MSELVLFGQMIFTTYAYDFVMNIRELVQLSKVT